MNEEDIELGMTVRLNSGGPVMTVEEIDDDVIHCSWFKTDLTVAEFEFYAPMLTRIF